MTRVDHRIAEFERAFAKDVGQTHAVSMTYARLGLRFTLEALGVKAGDEIIMSPLTCRVVVLALQSAGFVPAYADVQAGGINLDADAASRRITAKTRAILFQHTFGVRTGCDDVADLARARGLPLIEDCAHCLPPDGLGVPAGSRGVASLWSHNFRKPMPVGAGACIATSDAELARGVAERRDAGRGRSLVERGTWRAMRIAYGSLMRPSAYWVLWRLARTLRGDHRVQSLAELVRQEVTGQPVRISDTQAAWGLEALATAPQRAQRSRAIARVYAEGLRDLTSVEHVPGAQENPLYYFPVLAKNKRDLLDAARRHRLELIAWPLQLPIYPVEREADLVMCQYQPGSCPNAEERGAMLCGLPVDLMATDRNALRLVELIRQTQAGSGDA